MFDAFRDVVSRLGELSFEGLTTLELLRLLQRLEQDARCLPVTRHALINRVRQQPSAAEIGGKLAHVLADRLRITRGEATRRIQEAEDLGERRALTDEPFAGAAGGHRRRPARRHDRRRMRAGDPGVFAGLAVLDRRRYPPLRRGQACRLGYPVSSRAAAKLADKLADCLNPDGDSATTTAPAAAG